MLRWGILGLGKIAHKFVKDLQLLTSHTVTGVGSRSLEKARDFANTYFVKKHYGSYDELLNSEDIDIVYIATPHDSHLEWSIKAMDSNKHVLCEKPLAVNRAQVELMINSSRQNKVFLMEALWSRFNPSIKEIIAFCKQGLIGEIKFIQADFNYAIEGSPASRLYNMNLAGGSLLDMGIYPIFLAYAILGMPSKIQAAAQFHESGADIQTTAILEYPAALANVMSSFKAHSNMTASIGGTKGRIEIHPRWHETKSYTLHLNDSIEKIEHQFEGKGFGGEILECHRCITEGRIESPIWSHQDSLNLMSILDEIRTIVGLKYPFEQ